jgi:hypothetical protein
MTPAVLTLAHEGWSGLFEIRVVHATAQLPDWVGPPKSGTRALAAIANLVCIAGGMIVGARSGERLYRYLVIEKLRWLTQEEVNQARKQEKQYF